MNKACNEVLEILKHISPEMIDMLPRNVWERLEKEKDTYYKYKFDETKKIEEQKLSNEAIDILAYLYANYWTNTQEKEEYKKFLVQKEVVNRNKF